MEAQRLFEVLAIQHGSPAAAGPVFGHCEEVPPNNCTNSPDERNAEDEGKTSEELCVGDSPIRHIADGFGEPGDDQIVSDPAKGST